MIVDVKISTSPCNFCLFELRPIIFEDPPGYVEPVYDTLQEFDYYILCDVHYCHSFHPLGESLNSDK
jgi:hypothetical protein